jgi:hypothetical protein
VSRCATPKPSARGVLGLAPDRSSDLWTKLDAHRFWGFGAPKTHTNESVGTTLPQHERKRAFPADLPRRERDPPRRARQAATKAPQAPSRETCVQMRHPQTRQRAAWWGWGPNTTQTKASEALFRSECRKNPSPPIYPVAKETPRDGVPPRPRRRRRRRGPQPLQRLIRFEGSTLARGRASSYTPRVRKTGWIPPLADPLTQGPFFFLYSQELVSVRHC